MSLGRPIRGRVRQGVHIPLLLIYTPVGLAPQKVVETDEGDPTRDTYQRKVLYDGSYFFVVYWTGAPTREVRYTSSLDGITWASPTTLWGFTVAPFYGGNIDFTFRLGTKAEASIVLVGSDGKSSHWTPFNISDGTLIEKTGGELIQGTYAHGGGLCINPKGGVETECYLVNSKGHNVWAHRDPAKYTSSNATVSRDDTHETGGNALKPYNRESPYEMLALCQNADDELMWNLLKPTMTDSWINANFQSLATIKKGFSSFCATSQALMDTPREVVHLVYVKNTGELCYQKFEDGSWSGEKVLVVSGASYPVIALGSNERLYVFFVKNGKILVKHFDGRRWYYDAELFTREHTFNNPTYLSANQNVQNSKVCLVWTEGKSAPYEVWFCYLDD